MKRKLFYWLCLVGLLLAIAPIPYALASDITDATWYATIAVSNAAASTQQAATVFTMDTDLLIDGDYILSNCTNTAIRTSGGVDIPYMPARSTTDKWVVWVNSIAPHATMNYLLYTGGTTDMASDICWFPLAGGGTIVKAGSMDPTNNFIIQISGYIDTTAGASKNIVYYFNTASGLADIDLSVSAGVAGTVNATVRTTTPAVATATLAGIASGNHVITLTYNNVNLTLDIDGVTNIQALTGTVSYGGVDPWRIAQNGAMPYVRYFKETVGGVLRCHIEWENAATFTDLSGNGNTLTPTLRIATSDADVTADFTNYQPVDTAALDFTAGDDTKPMITAAPVFPAEMYTDDDYSNLPGAAVINSILDASSIPRAGFWFPIIFIGAILIGFLLWKFTNSLLAMTIGSGVFMAFFAFAGPIPMWVMIPFVVMAVALMIKRESPGGF